MWGGEGSYLYLIREGKAVRVPVTITSRRDGRVFVDGRVGRGDRVIVEGVQAVRDGQDIRLVRQAREPERDVRVENTPTRRSDGD